MYRLSVKNCMDYVVNLAHIIMLQVLSGKNYENSKWHCIYLFNYSMNESADHQTLIIHVQPTCNN